MVTATREERLETFVTDLYSKLRVDGSTSIESQIRASLGYLKKNPDVGVLAEKVQLAQAIRDRGFLTRRELEEINRSAVPRIKTQSFSLYILGVVEFSGHLRDDTYTCTGNREKLDIYIDALTGVLGVLNEG